MLTILKHNLALFNYPGSTQPINSNLQPHTLNITNVCSIYVKEFQDKMICKL